MLSPTTGTSQDIHEVHQYDRRPRVVDAMLASSHRIRLQCILQNRKVQVKEGLLESLNENTVELGYVIVHIHVHNHYVLSVCD